MTEEIKKNYFEELIEINVSDHIEKKNNLSYLSWAWAWQELKKKYPAAKRKVFEREDGRLYWDDGVTCWVKVSITINDIEEIEYLPILDYRNQPIHKSKVTSMNVNTSIQRATTKAIARHGLGLYVYAGEDLPEEDISSGEKLAKAADEDMKDQFQQQAQENFALVKDAIESCDSLESLQEVWQDPETKKIVNSFKKWNKDLFTLIEESKDAMKENLSK